MVLLTTTTRIQTILASLPPHIHSGLSQDVASSSPSIDHRTLITLSRLTNQPIHILLRGTSVYIPPPTPKPQPSPEYLALKRRLLQDQERREYAAMIAKRDANENILSGFGGALQDEEEDPISPSLVINIFLSVILCGAAVFIMTRWMFNDGIRVLVSLLSGVVVGVAEVGLYAIYLRKVDTARRKERGKKEVKRLIGEYKVDENTELVAGEGEMEEIWGRGVNGGMRRRVREKWEKQQEQENGQKDK